MRSKTLLVAGVGAAVLALAGCSPTSINGSAAPQGASAASGNGGGQSATDTGKISSLADLGAVVKHNATAKNSVHIQMAMSIPGAGAINASGDMKFAGAQSAERLTMSMPSIGDMGLVVVDGTFYMKLPSGLAGMMGGSDDKPWTKVDLNGDDPTAKSLGSTADLADQSDPSEMIDKIKSAGTITKVTQEQLNGEQTTHYAITVDVAKMADTMTGDDAEKQAMSQLGVKSMPFDIWVNSDNLPVRIITKIAYADPLGGGSQQVAMTVNYTNWGQPVTITAPPADQVGSLDGH
jgi:hypothetical protein